MLKKTLFSLLFLSPLMADEALLSPWSTEESKSYFSGHLPFKQDGKIDISNEIKHVKIDIGLSWCAPMTQVWLANEEDVVVFGFEPNPSAVKTTVDGTLVATWWLNTFLGSDHPLSKKSSIPELLGKRCFIIPCALGLCSTHTTVFYITEVDCGCSSMYEPVSIAVAKKIEVPILTLSNFFDHFPFDTHPMIDYIKIDAQGADLDIVKSAGSYLEERVVCVTIEPENNEYYGTINSLEEIESFMNSKGFIRYRSQNAADPTYVNHLFLDYFIKNNELHIFQQ